MIKLRSDIFYSGVFGIRRGVSAFLRESRDGYIIRSTPTGKATQSLPGRLVRVAAVALWVMIIALWVMPFDLDSLWRVQISILLLGVSGLLLIFSTQRLTHEFHVDTAQREVRSVVLGRSGKAQMREVFDFADIATLLLQKRKEDEGDCRLCLCLTQDRGPVPVCIGERATLLAIHDRLARDLRPLEEKMSYFGLKSDLTPRQRMRAAFPLLAPEETVT